MVDDIIIPEILRDFTTEKKPKDRLSPIAHDLISNDEDYCIDVHTHFFDMKCINAAYLILRMGKDFLGIRGDEESSEVWEKQVYKKIDEYNENWEDKLLGKLSEQEERGISLKIAPILTKKYMVSVYEYYIRKASLATYFGYDKSKVLTTALMMDFKHGWGVKKLGKSLSKQVEESFDLAAKYPVLPFLFCDPRRASDKGDENLYALFKKAFHHNAGFFGVKMYPSLGYHPNDFRLKPIYHFCEKYEIPIVTHCGGDSISTAEFPFTAYNGKDEIKYRGTKREDISYQLNDPSNWKPVLKQFPKLKLNLAHFGSSDTWSTISLAPVEIDPQERKETIINLMKEYPNVYSDFSYTIVDKKATKNFKTFLETNEIVKSRALYGSDFWVIYFGGDHKKKQEKFLNRIDDKNLIEILCKTNPKKFLFGS